MLSDKAKANLRRLRDDFPWYAPRVLKIRTKEGQLVPFSLNPIQCKVDKVIDDLQAARVPVRIIELKPRQTGLSTHAEGRIFRATSMHKLVNSLIIAHKEDASTNLFNMSKLFYEEMPAYLRPMRKASNAKELIFENPTPNVEEKQRNPGLRSKIKIDTAKNLGAGRSETIRNLHASEVAFWDNAEQVMLGLLQAVPDDPNTMVIVESTPNGVGGYFYNLWQQAKRGENNYIPVFLAWFEEPTYRRPVPEGFRLDDDEQEIAKIYGLDLEQMAWRRWCIENNCNGDADLFRQEYPANDTECFLTSGRPVFNSQVLQAMLEASKPPKIIGNMVEENGRVKFVKQDKGYLSVWQEPEEGHNYIISADVAEGLARGDYSVADVIDRQTLEQVAQWHGHIDPDLFGAELDKLARYYFRAFVVPEVNNHGLTTVTALKKLYRNIYRRRTVDRITNKARQEYGWRTDSRTKPLAIDKAAEHIRERTAKINCRETIEECLTFIRNDKGGMEAQEGCHDDRVMALAIGLYAAFEIPYSEESLEDIELERAFGRTGY